MQHINSGNRIVADTSEGRHLQNLQSMASRSELVKDNMVLRAAVTGGQVSAVDVGCVVHEFELQNRSVAEVAVPDCHDLAEDVAVPDDDDELLQEANSTAKCL